VHESATDRTSTYPFGRPMGIPVPGDYDGDGKSDYADFLPANGTWLIRYSSNGSTFEVQFGADGDQPTEAAFQ